MNDDLLNALAQEVRDERDSVAPGFDGAPLEDGFGPPLNEARRQAITDTLLNLPSDETASGETASAEVIALRPRWTGGAAATAVIAAAAILLLWPKPSALPTYELEVLGGEAVVRSDDGPRVKSSVRVKPPTGLEIIARPAKDVQETGRAQVFAKIEKRVVRLPVQLQPAPSGAFRWQGTGQALLGAHRGPVTLVVVISADAELSTERIHEFLQGGPIPQNVQLLQTPLIMESSGL